MKNHKLQAIDIAKTYNSRRVVDGLSIEIYSGEIVALLGPNGAGKTTTISILSGLHGRTSGISLVGGFDTETQMDAIHQCVGVCPQFDLLWPQLTVEEHLTFYARLKGVPSE